MANFSSTEPPNLTTTFNTSNSTQTVQPGSIPHNCLIDPQLALIVAASAGGLILFLVISTIVLTCKVILMKQQCQEQRHTRSNVDLVSGTGYWGTEGIQGGIVGPCETNFLLEEVRPEEEEEGMGMNEAEEEAVIHQCITTNMDGENVEPNIQFSTSRDSCIDVKELEDMPLVV